MKLCINCKSPLLQRSLESFLKNYLIDAKDADFVVSDRELEGFVFVVSKDIKKPFTKVQLINKLEDFYKKLDFTKAIPTEEGSKEIVNISLEKKLTIITTNYIKEVLKVVKEHYGER